MWEEGSMRTWEVDKFVGTKMHKKREKLVNVGKGKCGACGGGRHDLTRGATLPQCGGDRVKASYLSLQNYCYYCYLVFLVIIILI